MKILVTGASGFVGGAYVRRYRGRAGLHFHGVGRRALNVADYTAADLSRPFDVSFDPDVVVHAAARASPWGTRNQYQRHNVEATRHVIDF